VLGYPQNLRNLLFLCFLLPFLPATSLSVLGFPGGLSLKLGIGAASNHWDGYPSSPSGNIPVPSVSPVSGSGAPLNLTETAVTSGNDTMTESSVITQNPPTGWGNIHISCDISNVSYTTVMDDLVPDGDFSTNPWSNWTNTYQGDGHSYGWYSSDPKYIWHKFRADWSSTLNAWSNFFTSFHVPSANVCQSAVLSFKRSVTVTISGQADAHGYLQVLFDGVSKWYNYFTSSSSWSTVEVNVTNLVKNSENHDITLRIYNVSLFAEEGHSSFEACWDDVVLNVTWSESNNTLFSLSGHSFSYGGHVEFPTSASTWSFYGPPNATFNAQWNVTASKTGTTTPTYTAQPDADTDWNITVTRDVPSGWNYINYTVTGIPSDWTYGGCTPLGAGSYSSGQITGDGDATYAFTQTNIIEGLELELRFPRNNSVLRHNTDHFMRGDSFSANLTGVFDGTANLTIWLPNGGSWQCSSKNTTNGVARWTKNATNHWLVFPQDGSFGIYSFQATLEAEDGLHISTGTHNARLEGYMVTAIDATENVDGSVTVSGTFSSNAGGSPKLWVSSIIERYPAYDDPLDVAMGSTGLHLVRWRQSDAIINSTSEAFDVALTINNTAASQLSVTVHVRFLAALNQDYCILNLQGQSSIPSGGQHTFEWKGKTIGEGNLLLRRGLYRIQIEVETGSSQEEAYLDDELGNAFLVVSNGTDIDGRVVARKLAATNPGSYSVTFNRDGGNPELPVPAMCHFIASVEDEYHITSEHRPGTTDYQTDLHLRLFTFLSDPSAIAEAGQIFTLNTTLTEEQAKHVNHSDYGSQFQIHFYVDLNNDSDFEDPGEHVIETIGMGETAFHNFSSPSIPGKYSIACTYDGNEEHKASTVDGVLTVQDTTPPSWVENPTDQFLGPDDTLYDLNATDLSGLDQWWINDTTHFHIDQNGLITNITTLTTGCYPVQVQVRDIYGNTLTGVFTITVDVSPPTWISYPTNQHCELGVSLTYTLEATDPSGLDAWWLNDTVNFTDH